MTAEDALFSDNYFMREALREAEKARDEGEVPVGAVVVIDRRIIARAHNMTQKLMDVTAHAEMIALTSAANHLGSKYLHDCSLYVSLEPCAMCASALKWAQLSRLVFGASDPEEGFLSKEVALLHKKTEVVPGVLKAEAADLLRAFFKARR